MKKLGIIVQRYGNEVNGGAEYHARVLAEQLNKYYDVTILSTTALDYKGWKNHYPEGNTLVNGIKVIRFKTQSISAKKMRKARRAIMKKKKYFKLLHFLGLFNFFEKQFKITNISQEDINNWISGQGPYCPNLLDFIEKNKDSFDAFIFFTYLYYPTFAGIPLVKDKAIFIPTAHDEPPLYTKPYENLFSLPKFIMYNTLAEKELIENHFNEFCKNRDIAGVGIDEFHLKEDYKPSQANLSFDFPYFVYIGRIDKHKGCDDLVKYFNLFCKKNSEVKLVMIGKDFIGIPPSKNIILTGFLNEEDKHYLLKNSLGLILPSKFESLSLVTLEAMMAGKIPLVNSECKVLKDHIDLSNAGFYYNDYTQFETQLNKIISLSPQEIGEYATRAKRYVTENYTWDKILKKFDKAINFITQ